MKTTIILKDKKNKRKFVLLRVDAKEAGGNSEGYFGLTHKATLTPMQRFKVLCNLPNGCENIYDNGNTTEIWFNWNKQALPHLEEIIITAFAVAVFFASAFLFG